MTSFIYFTCLGLRVALQTLIVGPIPWEYIVVPGRNRMVMVREVYRCEAA